MKRFIPILLGLLTLTACPQAGQILGPSVTNATAPKDGEGDSASSATPPDTTPPPPDIAPPPPPSDTAAASDPIEPKSDSTNITPPGASEWADLVRLRYGNGFETILTLDVTGKISVGANGEIDLPAIAESRDKMTFPWLDSVDSVIRMVYQPLDASAKPQYCDANVLIDYSPEEGGDVLFSGVSAAGSLTFLHLSPLNTSQQKTEVNQSSDPISPCSSGWKPWNNENPSNSNWIPLGSLETQVQVSNVTTRPTAHQATSHPVLKP
jgi:hypothetical protein